MTKHILSVVGALAVAATLSPLNVTTSAAEMTCRIPFDFTVNGSLMPAGVYTFSTHDAMMSVSGPRGGALVLTSTASTSSTSIVRKAVFDRTDDGYVLREAWLGGYSGRTLPAPRVNPDRPKIASNAPVERVEIRGL
jgi:hypothetical protein